MTAPQPDPEATDPSTPTRPKLTQRTHDAAGRKVAAASQRLSEMQDRSEVLALGFGIGSRDRDLAGSVLGSAVAFRLFLFFIPSALFTVGLMGLLSSWISIERAAEGTGISSAVSGEIEKALAQSSAAHWLAVSTGLLGMATAGRALTKVLVASSALAWQLPLREQRLTIRVTGLVVSLVVAIALFSGVAGRLRAAAGLAVGSLSFAVGALAYLVAWMVLSVMLPRGTRDPGAALPGAALMAVVIVVMQAITQMFLVARVTQASALYGSMGLVVVTLGWFFVIGRAAVMSFTLNAVVYERHGSVSRLVFSLPLLRRLPARWPPIARFFQLDGMDQDPEPTEPEK